MAEPLAPPFEDLRRAASTVTQQVGPSVVRVGRHGGRGCGLVVADGHVLTNSHNLRDRTTEVTFADGRSVQAEVVAVDPDGDLAVLAVDTAAAPALAWADRAAGQGDVVFAVTRTSGGDDRVSFGMVSGVDRAFRGPRGRRISGSLEHTVPLVRGSSGSPVVDAAGLVVGINTARLGDGFYLAIPADADLRERVDALLRGESPRRLVLGVGIARPEVAARLRASVGLSERAGLLVRSVDPGSPAGRAGIAVGDLLIAADGRDIAAIDDLHDALEVARSTGALALRAVRGTDELDLAVSFDDADA